MGVGVPRWLARGARADPAGGWRAGGARAALLLRQAADEMDVVAFHPDSDTGPQPDDHPMVNRTIVDGVSATNIAAIRTKD